MRSGRRWVNANIKRATNHNSVTIQRRRLWGSRFISWHFYETITWMSRSKQLNTSEVMQITSPSNIYKIESISTPNLELVSISGDGGGGAQKVKIANNCTSRHTKIAYHYRMWHFKKYNRTGRRSVWAPRPCYLKLFKFTRTERKTKNNKKYIRLGRGWLQG